MVQKNDSLKKRYVSKLISNLVTFSLGFVTLGMVPRALGPEAYGNFSFLTNFFNSTTKFLRFGIPAAYLTKLSKRTSEKKLIGFYIYYILALVLFVFTGTIGAITLGFQEIIWPDQKSVFIFAAALLALIQFISNFLRSTNDSFGFTVSYERIFIVQSILSTVLIVLLYILKIITLSTLFLMHYCVTFFIIFAGWKVLSNNKISLSKQLSLTKTEITSYIKEFYHFSHPLFFNGLVVYFVAIGDRWLLQHFYGSAEQGYYTFALKISSIVFLFTSAMSTLLIREMSLSYKDKNKGELKRLFKRNIPLFYFISAYFAVFISLNAGTVCSIIGGDEYINASSIISVIVFYPVHQTYGQLGGSVFLATERTKIIRNVGMITGLLGFILSFFIITSYGFGLGAIGLASKMVLVQIVAVNIYLWINTKFLEESFKDFFINQILVLFLLFLVGKISLSLSEMINFTYLYDFIFSGIIYTVFVTIILFYFPSIIFLERSEMQNYYRNIFNVIKIKLGMK